jgi:hypothetical protein
MPITRNPRVQPMKEFAASLGAKIKVEYPEVGLATYVLYDGKGERLVSEYDTFDMLDSIEAYFGGHPDYVEARAQFEYMTSQSA